MAEITPLPEPAPVPEAADILAAFCDHQRRHSLAPRTISNRRKTVALLATDMPGGFLNATAEDLAAWIDSRPLNGRSRTEYLKSLRAFYDWAMGVQLRPDHPMRRPPVTVRSGRTGDERTVVDLIEPYLKHRQQLHEIGPLTARNSRYVLGMFAEAMGDRRVSRLSRRDVEQWLKTLENNAASTRRSYFVVVRMFCRWLSIKGHVRKDPMAEIPPVKVPRSIPRALSRDKLAKLLAVVPDERGMLMCLLELQEGLRSCEVARLQMGDVDLEGRTMQVRGKGSHERLLPLTDETMSALQSYLSKYPAAWGPLIRNYDRPSRGLSTRTVSFYINQWFAEAGIKRHRYDGISAHALRHTAATDVLRGGAHLRDVQRMLGHRHLQATETYLPLVVNDLRDAMDGRTYRNQPPGPARNRQE